MKINWIQNKEQKKIKLNKNLFQFKIFQHVKIKGQAHI